MFPREEQERKYISIKKFHSAVQTQDFLHHFTPSIFTCHCASHEYHIRSGLWLCGIIHVHVH
ncbi:MAG: hypothetical protein MJE68_32455, partial [Proteobacteria bacterium]|nr:hypothetical protein [Pseudomonadota bacterium]